MAARKGLLPKIDENCDRKFISLCGIYKPLYSFEQQVTNILMPENKIKLLIF